MTWGVLLFLALGLAAGAFAFGRYRSPIHAAIRIEPDQTFQTFHDWEATAVLLGTAQEREHRFALFDRLFQDIGITRLRLETFSGAESKSRSMQRFLQGEIDMDGWKSLRYPTENDNDDPFVIDPAGFDFFDLDYRVENTVLPMLDRARARDETLSLTFTYVAFTKQIKGREYIHTDPEEYAEFILAAFLHLKEKYGLEPEYFEPLLEPDNSPLWDPVLLGRAIRAATLRLADAGFHPRTILPSVADASLTLDWLDGIARTPGALDGMAELSYHRYKGASARVLKAIATRAAELGVATGMLEYWFGNATHELLFQDLTLANVSAWQPRAAYNFHRIAEDGQIVLQDEMRFNRLYFAAIRPGDVRIGAVSDTPGGLDPVAFRKPDGRISVVLEASRPASGIISGLPEGDYLIETAHADGGSGPERGHAGPEGTLSVDIPAAGVIAVRPAS